MLVITDIKIVIILRNFTYNKKTRFLIQKKNVEIDKIFNKKESQLVRLRELKQFRINFMAVWCLCFRLLLLIKKTVSMVIIAKF